MTTSDGDEIEDEAFLELMKSVARTPDVSALRRDIGRGTELLGRFVIQGQLGEGGMGRVYVAFDRQRQAEVALKMLGVLTPQSIVALKREFRVAAELIHPNLVRLYELFSEGDEWFFAMELLDGVTLGRLLATRPGGEVPLIRHVFGQLAQALRELHDSGSVHGDLKPSNFLIVGPQQRVVLLDFGVARPLGQARAEYAFAGTREYGAPEQLAGAELTRAADWYSFGVVLFQSLTGSLPEPSRLGAQLQGAPAELAQLCIELLRSDPLLRPDQAAIQAVLGAEMPNASLIRKTASQRHFIGRSAERAELLAAYTSLAPGKPQLVLVRGDSGLGKTALVEQFTSELSERGAIVLRARCRERELTSYKAVDGLIDDLVTYLDQLQRDAASELLPEGLADLTRLFPALRTAAAVVARADRDAFDGSDQSIVKQRAIAAFRDLLEALSRRAPLVIWIDDLQWSDAQSAALLAPILAGPRPIGLLLVGGCRSTGGGRGITLDVLYEQLPEGLPPPLLIELSPLPGEDAQSLARDLLPKDAASQVLARDIAEEANGSPLFIAELVHQVTSAPGATSAASAARSLTQLVRSRVASLPADARGLLEMAALAGMPLTRATARRSRGLTPNREEEVIDLLRAQHLIRTYATAQERNLDLYHDRIREIVLNGVANEARAEHHLWLARALTTESRVKPELVATHFFAGGLPKEAGSYWVKAADAAFEALAFGHAAELYDRGARYAALDTERLGLVRARQAEAMAYDGKGAAAADVYLLAAEGRAQNMAIELRRRAAEQLLLAGHLERGLEVVGMVLRDLRMRSTRSGWHAIPSILAGRARVRLRGMRFRVREASEIPERTLARVDASWSIACSLGVVDFMRGADFQNDHLLLALGAGEPRRLLRALTLEISYVATSGRGSEQKTLALLQMADALAERVDDPAAAGLVRVSRGVAAYLTGRFDEALVQCQAGVTTLRRLAGTVWETVTAQRFIVASLFHLGRLAALAESVPALVAEAETNGNLYASMAFRTTYSNAAWLVSDRVTQAHEHLNAARQQWRAPGVQLPHCWMFVGETHLALYTGQTSELWRKLQTEWPRFNRAQFLRIGMLRVQLWHLRAVIATCQASLQLEAGSASDARQLYREARQSAARLASQRFAMARPLADLTLAAVDSATGDQESARRRLTQCVDTFTTQDMRLYAAAARIRLGELVGGDEGAVLVGLGASAFTAEGVVDIRRFLDVLAPFSGSTRARARLGA